MSPWSCHRAPVLSGHGVRCSVLEHGTDLGFARALDLLEDSRDFRDFVGELIVACDCAAIRWECPPVTRATLGRGFEFVLVDDPLLDAAPEPAVFAPYFEGLPPDTLVTAVPNLGRTARLVVPRAGADLAAGVHLKAFLLGAPRAQVDQLWRCVVQTVRQDLSNRPLWLSTAGGGVNWLHVRIEGEPKFYVHRPYATGA